MQTFAETPYRCPGETYDISRAIHLGRLSAFYEACRDCPRRGEVGGLLLPVQKRLAEMAASNSPSVLQTEGLAGVGGEQLDAPLARCFASAFGLWLRDQIAEDRPTVLLAGDDRPLTSELVAAAGQGLRYVGCNLVDLGGATSACLASSLISSQAAGGVLVGNSPSQLRTASLSLWQRHGKPISTGAQNAATSAENNLLRQLWSQAERPIVRPERRSGGWQRGSFEAEYLAALRPYFHALRPLNFQLDTLCTPLTRYLRKLLANVACRAYSATACSERSGDTMHFRVWIDGNGECLRLEDEQGAAVAAEDLLSLLALHLASERSEAAVVVEQGTAEAAVRRLKAAGLQVIYSAATRAAMHASMVESNAILGGGPSGRFWFNEPAPIADPLRAIALLLVILSQSDRPLSQVLRGE